MPASELSQLAETVWTGDQFSARRLGRYFLVELRSPHRVLSTSAHCGGEQEGVRFLANHQSCEGRGDTERQALIAEMGLARYHREVCAELGIDPDRTALMGTAASMACVTHRHREFGDLQVDAFVSAGVKGNATTAGDPARWVETESGWAEASRYEGTINIILVLGFSLSPSALASAAVTMTEAKSAALAELAVPSLSSCSVATGTGTDQFCLAHPLDSPGRPKESTSTHVKAGEIIGVAVKEAVKEALRWQNGLEPSYTRGFFHALGRFGLTQERVLEYLRGELSEREFALLADNLNAVFYEPGVGAAAHALAAVLDRVRCGTLPEAAVGETVRQQAACLASCVAARPQNWPVLYAALSRGDEDPLDLILRAVAQGWKAKWA